MDEIASCLLEIGIMIYGILVMIGGVLTGNGFKLANGFARWIYESLFNLAVWIVKLPFRILSRILFGKKKKRKRKRRN